MSGHHSTQDNEEEIEEDNTATDGSGDDTPNLGRIGCLSCFGIVPAEPQGINTGGLDNSDDAERKTAEQRGQNTPDKEIVGLYGTRLGLIGVLIRRVGIIRLVLHHSDGVK